MIVAVDEGNIKDAARVHSEAWRESHRAVCSPEFVAAHDEKRQGEYLRGEIAKGKKVFLLIKDVPAGVVSVLGGLIENLYVLPERQGRGYGTELLRFALEKCEGEPTLWILNNNQRAKRLYERNGFAATGRIKKLTESLSEIEMVFRV